MERPWTRLAATLLLASPAALALSEFGIEGMHAVSTPANEIRGSVSPDGTRIAWGSPDRAGGPGGWDIWTARREGGRWTDPRPASFDGTANDFDPMFSANGRWLYFFSNRPGGRGGDDLYRVAVDADGSFGDVQSLGDGVNTPGDEWAPTPSRDGQHLLFASDGLGGAGRHDLFVARWDGHAFVDPKPVPGINTADDDFDAAWLDDGRAIVFARSTDADEQPIQLFVARCDGARYVDAKPLALSFNTADGWTLGPAIDWNKPNELLVSGAAKAPHAGKLDIYRMAAPRMEGRDGCVW
jgi:Tol biopolymer transport system component